MLPQPHAYEVPQQIPRSDTQVCAILYKVKAQAEHEQFVVDAPRMDSYQLLSLSMCLIVYSKLKNLKFNTANLSLC